VSVSGTGAPPGGPWWSEGLRFECQPDCGQCCTNHDDYAYVYLEGQDVDRIAGHLAMSPEAFRETYTTLDDGETVLLMDAPACPFLEGSRCRVYDARPRQCRTFPFWRENLRSRARWDALKSFCPGVGRGAIIPVERIRSQLTDDDRG
jgi:uncharacterized protein